MRIKTKKEKKDELYFGEPDTNVNTLKWFALNFFVYVGTLALMGGIAYFLYKAIVSIKHIIF